MKLAVVGIGSSLRGDDAAGLEAVRIWQDTYGNNPDRACVEVAQVSAPSVDLLNVLTGKNAAVLVDAVCSGAIPGTLHRLSPEDLAALKPASPSAHAWGVAEVLRLGAILDPTSGSRVVRVLGVEASRSDFGTAMSDEVRSALPIVSAAIEAELDAFLK